MMTEKFNIVGEGGEAPAPAPAPAPNPAPEKPSGPVTQTHDDGSTTVFENRDGEYVYQDFDTDGNPVGPPRRGGTSPSGLGERDPGPKAGDGGAEPASSSEPAQLSAEPGSVDELMPNPPPAARVAPASEPPIAEVSEPGPKTEPEPSRRHDDDDDDIRPSLRGDLPDASLTAPPTKPAALDDLPDKPMPL